MVAIHSPTCHDSDHHSRVSKNAALGITAIVCFCIVAAVLLVPVAAHATPAQLSVLPPPLKQMQQGVEISDIRCNDERILAASPGGTVACVYPGTAERLVLRGWEVLPQPEQETDAPGSGIHADSPETPRDLLVPGHATANETQASVYEPLYYVMYNKITLSGVEKKITDPSGFIFPVTTEEAVNTVMPRLASGIGDRLILPAANKTSSSYAYVTYDTEMGNKFRTAANHEYPDAIQRIEYTIHTNVGYYEYEEFFTSFMDGAGLPFKNISYAPSGGSVYGNYHKIYFNSFTDYAPLPHLVLYFEGWMVGDIKRGELLPRSEIKKLAFDFAAKYSDVLDEERCLFEPITSDDERVRYVLKVHAGVPIYSVIVGHCTAHGTKSLSVAVEATAGEIVWFNSSHMKDGWIDMLDIPEYAKVRNGEKHD